MSLKTSFFTCAFLLATTVVQAQQAPTPTVPVTTMNYGTPAAALGVQPPAALTAPAGSSANQAKPLPDANQAAPMTQAESYIWFGNDAINGAAGLIKSGRYVEALAALDKVIQRDMRLSEAHLLQGVAYMQMKDLEKAKRSFGIVMAIDRAYLGAYIYMADIAVQEKNTEQAKVYLQAIKAVCLTTECAEYQYLKNALRSRNIDVPE
jgi:Tfp pilus assembly protein PilF